MPPSPPKKPSPKKKKKAVKADYGGIYFGEAEAETSRGEADAAEEEVELDPMATYRMAAAAAAKALAKEREQEKKDEANVALYKKIFSRMDADADGVVDMGDVIEKVAAGTAQLSQRAQAARPAGAVALQLPMTFGLVEWVKEMKRMAGQMDEQTFEANVLGLFACFNEVDGSSGAPPPIELKAPPGTATSAPAPLDRLPLLQELFNTMDTDGDGLIDLDDFLSQARNSVEADELRSLFHFFDATFGAKSAALNFEAFSEGTLTRTPIGKLKDAAFASAIRGMTLDVKKALAAKAATQKRLVKLQALFQTMDLESTGTVALPQFLAQAKSEPEKEELAATFEDFDKIEGAADGTLTFRKFATGTLMHTPLGKMRDDHFEQTVEVMINDVREKLGSGAPPPPPPPPSE